MGALKQLKSILQPWGISAPSAECGKIAHLSDYILDDDEYIEEPIYREPLIRSMPLKRYILPLHNSIPEYAEILKSPHTLVAGRTGCGKSVFMHSLIYELMGTYTPKQAGLILIDPKRVELVDYKNTPFCLAYSDENKLSADILEEVCELIEDRYATMQETGVKNWNGGKVYIVIDELADLLIDSEVGRRVKRLLQKILQIGRASGVSIIAATQCPSRKILPAELTLNFTARLALKCNSAIESRQAVNVKGAEMLPNHGKALYLGNNGLQEIEIPLLPSAALDKRISFWETRK